MSDTGKVLVSEDTDDTKKVRGKTTDSKGVLTTVAYGDVTIFCPL